jgi:hypothetical protein
MILGFSVTMNMPGMITSVPITGRFPRLMPRRRNCTIIQTLAAPISMRVALALHHPHRSGLNGLVFSASTDEHY